MTPDDFREECRRRMPQALMAMFRVVAAPTASPPARLAALHRLVDLAARQVVSLDEFAAARAAANVSCDDWAAAVQELRAGRR